MMPMLRVIAWECRHLVADTAPGLMLVVLLLAGSFALWNGVNHLHWQRQLIAEAEHRSAAIQQKAADLADRLWRGTVQVPYWADPRIPSSYVDQYLSVYAVKPPYVLSALSTGQSDLYPNVLGIHYYSRDDTLSGSENANPDRLLVGRFDGAFVVVYLMPLLLLALVYNLLSADRERGTLPLIAAGSVDPSRIAAARVLVRWGVMTGVLAVLAALGCAMLGGFSAESPRFCLWVAVMAGYGLFWAGLAYWLAHRRSSSATNAVTLAGAWLLFTIVLPSVVSTFVKIVYPAPPRMELVLERREASDEAVQKRNTLLARYYEDHPQLAPNAGAYGAGLMVPDYAVQWQLSYEEVERELAPIRERFQRQLDLQQSLVDRLKYLSPALLAQSAFNDLSGTGLARHRQFLSQAGDMHTALQEYFGPRIMARNPMMSLEGMPEYRWREQTWGEQVAGIIWSLLYLFGVSAALFLVAGRGRIDVT
jgi:ABC-2 type transport system permease protein